MSSAEREPVEPHCMSKVCVCVCVQELQYQQAQSSQGPADTFVPVVSQFVTVASFSFSDVEESLNESKDVVSGPRHARSVQLLSNAAGHLC